MRKLLPTIIAVISLLSGCKQKQSTKEFKFEALVGKWVSTGGHAIQYEEWKTTDSGNYLGAGYVIEGGDTTFFESLEIVKVEDSWSYRARVSSGNHGETIPFLLSKQADSKIEFSNEKHDFPRKIGYEFISENEMQAYIEGPRDGQNIRILFDFRRAE